MQNLIRYTVIVVLGALLFVPFLGHVHLFDWDEINFAECAREMIVSKDYLRAQIDFQPFWEKPPLFIWMQAMSMTVFGVNEFAARFPNALMGIITLCTLYHVGKRVVNEKMAIWWVLIYAATWLPHFYFKSGIIDPTFNFFIFVAFYQVHLLKFDNKSKKILHALLCGIFLGLAVMTKGPVAILVAMLSFIVYVVVNKGLWGYKIVDLLWIIAGVLMVFGVWFILLIMAYGMHYFQWFFNEFITYQIRLFSTEDADHGGPFFYHFLVLLIGCFPAAAFLFQYTRKRTTDNEPARDFTRWMWILFWVVLLLFSIVKTKIVHYSSLCYFPLSFLAALQLYRLSEGQEKMKKLVLILQLVTGSLIAILITALPLVGMYKQKIIPLIDDPFAVANFQADVSWSLAECGWGLVYLRAIWVTVFFMRKDFRKGMLAMMAVQLLLIQITVLHFTPKVEAYSQRAAIEFFKTFKGKDVYVQVLGYKSFAHLFYTDKTKPTNPAYYDSLGKANEKWLLKGNVDKPTYFCCKITAADEYLAMPTLQELYRKNGFVFFKRR